jgi:PAS domain S-box-containing protein
MSVGRIRKIARNLAQPTTYLGVAMLAFIYCAVGYLLVSDRNTAFENAVRRGENIVGIFDQAYAGTFKSVDDGLLFLRRTYERNPTTFDLTAMVSNSPLSSELIIGFVITNADGRIADTSLNKKFIGADRGKEEAFLVQRHAATDELFIGKPIILKSGGRRGMVLNRRLATPDGKFAGVIAAFIDPAQLGKMPGAFDLGPDGTFALTGFDGVIRTRGINGKIDWKSVGRQIAPDAGVLAYAAQAKSGTFWNKPGLLGDNVSRLISFRVLESFPLVAVATISEAEVYRNANENARIYGAIALLLTVAILIAIGVGAMRERKLIDTTSKMKQVQECLQRSQERYTLVEGAVNDGIFDRNLVTGEAYYSPRWKSILGYDVDEAPNDTTSWLELIHPDDNANVLEALNAHLEHGQPYGLDYRLRRKDGDYCWVHSRGTVLRDANGRPVRMVGISSDISERKQAEEVLARANQELEARVAERTAELSQEMRRREEAQMKLAQTQKMEAVGQLTAGIAHDFNNLLAVIRGSLEFIEAAAARGLPTEPDLIDAALRATRRGRELVQRLLAFARQSPLHAEPTVIDQLVLDTLRLLQRTLGEGIDIETRLGANAAIVSVDRNQLANALLNLALNARDAMPDGGQLTIATTCGPAEWTATEGSNRWPTGQEEVRIVISDTGVGMTEDVRRRAIEPFFTTKPDGLGSGLGLSMVQGFVEQSGGHIEIDSAVGHGTTITIKLPRIASAFQADESTAADGLTAIGQEKIVLLVEDDPDVRTVTAAQLKYLGYKVHAVANGMEAIDLIESPASIDITLTDMVLPGGIDGMTLVKEAMRARPRMGVLCMSGYDPTRKHRQWLDVQNIEFLEKPFSIGRLAQALDSALAH